MTVSISSCSSRRLGAQTGFHGLGHATGSVAASPVLRLVSQPEGLLQVHTAPFRGSVPAVLSQALRAAGLGSRVLISQFLKGGVDQGVERPITLSGRLQWLRPAMVECVDGPGHSPDAIVALWEHCRGQLLSGAVDLLVLDELGLAVAYDYLGLDAVVATLEQRPAQMDVILTGPSMPEPLMAMADQVTQLRRGF